MELTRWLFDFQSRGAFFLRGSLHADVKLSVCQSVSRAVCKSVIGQSDSLAVYATVNLSGQSVSRAVRQSASVYDQCVHRMLRDSSTTSAFIACSGIAV